jgi:hypothetical protein
MQALLFAAARPSSSLSLKQEKNTQGGFDLVWGSYRLANGVNAEGIDALQANFAKLLSSARQQGDDLRMAGERLRRLEEQIETLLYSWVQP